MGIILQAVLLLCKMMFLLMKFFGFEVVVFVGILNVIIEEVFNIKLIHTTFEDIEFYIIIVYMIYRTVNNIIQAVTDNQEFSLFKRCLECTQIIRGYKSKKSIKKHGFKANTRELEVKKEKVSGFFFGKKNGKYITAKENEDGHILVIGGAGSGKSSCIAIQTLKTWEKRVFAIDIKGELTSKSKRNGKVFSPGNLKAYGYDPYYILNRTENKVQAAREIALSLIPLSADVKEPFWIESAQNLLTACILHFSIEMNFINSMISIKLKSAEELVQIVSESSSIEAKMYVSQFIGMDNKTLSGVFTELSNKIMIFATDYEIQEALSKEEIITPEDLERGEDIFLQIREEKLEQWKYLLNLIVTQFLKYFERRNEDKENEHILFLLDEFARLGKVDGIANALATLRSKKIHVALFIQSLAQLDINYGRDVRRIIVDNAAYTAILGAKDVETQEEFSKRVGTHEEVKISNNANFEAYTGLGKGTGLSKSYEEKRIIKPEEFAYLDYIVLLTPKGYLKISKVPYYKVELNV